MGDNRPARYEEAHQDSPGGSRIIYRASSLGMCDKVFVALAMGYEPKAHPAWFQEILDEGTENEAIIRTMYEEQAGTEVIDVGRILEMEILEGVWIRGSIDGREFDDGTGPILNEFKKIRDSGWMKYLRSGVEYQANYPMQTSFYMFALGEAHGHDYAPMAFTGGHNVQDEKTGEWSITEIHTHSYLDPPVPLLAIKRRIAKLERLIKEVEAVGDIECSTKMYPCPFYYLHDDDDDEPPTRPGDDIVEPLIQEWADMELEQAELAPVKARLGQLDAIGKRVKEGVKAWLQASGQESGDVSTLAIGNAEVAVKYLTSPKVGYTVEPSEQTRVTIKVTAREGKKVADAPKKSSTKRSAAPKPQKAEDNSQEPTPEAAPSKKTLAPRPTKP